MFLTVLMPSTVYTAVQSHTRNSEVSCQGQSATRTYGFLAITALVVDSVGAEDVLALLVMQVVCEELLFVDDELGVLVGRRLREAHSSVVQRTRVRLEVLRCRHNEGEHQGVDLPFPSGRCKRLSRLISVRVIN